MHLHQQKLTATVQNPYSGVFTRKWTATHDGRTRRLEDVRHGLTITYRPSNQKGAHCGLKTRSGDGSGFGY